MCPIQLWQMGNDLCLRGQIRGMYQVGHTIGSFTNGEIISGSGNLAGKVFMIVSPVGAGPGNNTPTSFNAIEISPTLPTN
jgi:hypothetical protein